MIFFSLPQSILKHVKNHDFKRFFKTFRLSLELHEVDKTSLEAKEAAKYSMSVSSLFLRTKGFLLRCHWVILCRNNYFTVNSLSGSFSSKTKKLYKNHLSLRKRWQEISIKKNVDKKEAKNFTEKSQWKRVKAIENKQRNQIKPWNQGDDCP